MTTLVFCAGASQPCLDILPADAVFIGVDGGAAKLAAQGIIPDWAIGDFDTAEPPEQARRIVRLPEAKDDTDLEAALSYILARYQIESVDEVIIVGALGGGRLDHLLCNIWLAHQPRFATWLDKIRLIERHNSIRFYRAGSYRLHRETDKRYLSFISLTPVSKLHLHNVRYPLDGRDYDYPVALISNEFLADEMQFSFEEGLMCVIQSVDEPNKST